MSASPRHLFLRTKISSEVNENDITARELILGNSEQSLYVKDNDGYLLHFTRTDDTTSSSYVNWSSAKVENYIYLQFLNRPNPLLYITDGTSNETRGFQIDSLTQPRWAIVSNGLDGAPNTGSPLQIYTYLNNDSSAHLVADCQRDTSNNFNFYRSVYSNGSLYADSNIKASGLFTAGSANINITDASGYVDYTKIKPSSNDKVLGYYNTGWTPRSYNTKSFLLTSSGGTPTNTNGCLDPSRIETTTHKLNYTVLDFINSSDTRAYWNCPVPRDMTGSTFTPIFYWVNTSNDGNVKWSLSSTGFTNGDTLDSSSVYTSISSTAVPAVTGNIAITSGSSLTVNGNISADGFLNFTVKRDTSVANNSSGIARLIAIKLEYTPQYLI